MVGKRYWGGVDIIIRDCLNSESYYCSTTITTASHSAIQKNPLIRVWGTGKKQLPLSR